MFSYENGHHRGKTYDPRDFSALSGSPHLFGQPCQPPLGQGQGPWGGEARNVTMENGKFQWIGIGINYIIWLTIHYMISYHM